LTRVWSAAALGAIATRAAITPSRRLGRRIALQSAALRTARPRALRDAHTCRVLSQVNAVVKGIN
jgi:hypothetical protein